MVAGLLLMPKELRFICRLKDLMSKREMTQSELHRISGLSMTTIRSLTSGAILERIDRGSTAKLLNALNCDFEDLYEVKWIEITD